MSIVYCLFFIDYLLYLIKIFVGLYLHVKKLKLIEWLVGLTDQTIIEKIKWLKDDQTSATDWWDEISKAEKASIERGLEDIKNGRITLHEEVRKKYEKWL